MTDDAFKDLFGGDNALNDFLKSFNNEGFRMPDVPDPKGNALLMTFTREVIRGDRKYLERAVIEYKQEVYEREENFSLLEAHAKAALFVEKLSLCCESLRRIKKPNPKQNQAIGLVEYNMGNYGLAIKSFKAAKEDLSLPARIAYSLSLLEMGLQGIRTHEEILKPALEKLGIANSILGYLAFNASDYESAEKYLGAAARLSPNSERARLDLMRVMDANGKTQEVYAQMNGFYVDTNSRLTAEEVTRKIKERNLSISKVPIKNLFQVVDSLLGQNKDY